MERIRKKDFVDPEIAHFEKSLAETLGTRVIIERRENGGKITIDFFSNEDLKNLLQTFNKQKEGELLEGGTGVVGAEITPKEESEEDLYSIKNFSI